MIGLLSAFFVLVIGCPVLAQSQGSTTLDQDETVNAGPVKPGPNSTQAPIGATATAANSNNAVLTNIVGGQSGWRLQGSLSHLPALRNDQEDVSEILMRADYTLNKKHRVRVQQFFTKFYGVYESEYEFKPTDTTLVHYYSLDGKPLGMNLLWANSLALPISHESARDDLLTRYTSSLIATKVLFGGKLMLFGVPYGRYHFYEYKTSVSGTPLPWYTLGLAMTGLYFITPDLSLAVTGDYNFEGTRSSQFDNSQKDLFAEQNNQGLYSVDLWLSYQFSNALSASAYYTQGASYMQSGRYELVFYDNENSRFGANLTYIY